MKNVKNIQQITSYYPPHLGGMENSAKELSTELAKRNYKINVFTSNIGANTNKDKPRKNYNVHYLKSLEFAHTPLMYSLLFKLFAIPKNSIIHLHISQAYTPEIVYLVSKIRRIPFIAHMHLDVDPSGPMGFLLKPYKKIFLKPVLQKASKVICLSDLQKSIIINKYNLKTDKVIVLPNGVGKKYFYKRTINNKKNPTLLFVGRIAPQKNLTRLITAISLMHNNCNLQIVGEGEEHHKIVKLIKELNLKNVKLLGRKIGDELIELYKNADIFVLSSNKEGIPLALLEAMAVGLPIVASNIDGVNELLGDAGVLVNKPSPKTFANALDTVINNIKLQRKISQKAYQKATLYSWEILVNKLEALYSEVVI